MLQRRTRLLYLPFLILSLVLRPVQARINKGYVSDYDASDEIQTKQNQLSVSSVIPSLRDTLELSHLSAMVYGFRSSDHAPNCSSFPDIYEQYMDKIQPSIFIHSNASYTCHMYERDEQDTQVMVLSKDEQDGHEGYIAVVYAGTDDFRSALTDADVLTKIFGPTGINDTHPLAPSDDIRVHAGFNNAVFNNGLFDRIKDQVNEIKDENPDYRLLTTGHSLGAADAVLTAVAMKLQDNWSDELIVSVNFGCPKTGYKAWRDFVNSIDGLGIWRVVNGLDLVPRLPGPSFHHVGHTLQLYRSGARAFWLHGGDKSLGFRGVPWGWNTMPYALAPAAAYEHMIGHYVRFLDERSAKDKKKFYVDSFERISGSGDDDEPPDNMIDDDDIWSNIPDDDIRADIRQEKIVELFYYLVRQQQEALDVLAVPRIAEIM
jgi:hypothetical protein